MSTQTHHTTQAAPVGAVLRIPISQVEPGPNARGDLGDVGELSASLRTAGQLIPVVVEQVAPDRFQLLDGHRRRAAALAADLPYLDAVIRRHLEPAERLVRQLAIESHSRAFDPMAEARALHELMFTHRLSREQNAHAVGRPGAWVRDRIALSHLTEWEQKAVEAGRMSIGEALRRLKDRRDAATGRPATHGGRKPAPPRPAPAASTGEVCPTCGQSLSTTPSTEETR